MHCILLYRVVLLFPANEMQIIKFMILKKNINKNAKEIQSLYDLRMLIGIESPFIYV
jgi:hypothetical protein